MAGIGFSLKKLFNKKGVFNLCRAYGYAGLICAGPMILGVILLTGVAFLSQLAGMDQHHRELLNCMLTYCLLASLTTTSIFNMGVTRFVSDMLYEEKASKIMPSLYGSCAILLVGGAFVWCVFLHFSGVSLVYKLLCLWFYVILIVVWMEMNYLTALKDYKVLVMDFAASLGIGLLLALILVLLRMVTITTLFLCVILAYGLLMTLYYRQLLKYFPKSSGSCFSFLRWFDKYRSLTFTGIFVNLGLFAHLVIMYFGPLQVQVEGLFYGAPMHDVPALCAFFSILINFGPLQVQVEGLFYGAPMHDVPALCAFFSILITTINFVTSVEVRFYPKYKNYYSLFNDNGSIRDIEQAEMEMLAVLKQELTFNAHKQLISTLLFIVIGSLVLEILPLGMNDTSMGIYRLLCAGYGLYAISNTIMLILLYFEDYAGALMGTTAFAAVSILATVWQILFGEVNYYGFGFLLGGLSFYLVSWLRLEWYTKRLPYFLLSRQALVQNKKEGIFSRLCNWLERKEGTLE